MSDLDDYEFQQSPPGPPRLDPETGAFGLALLAIIACAVILALFAMLGGP